MVIVIVIVDDAHRYTILEQVGPNTTCEDDNHNLMAAYTETNMTEFDCYQACLNTCFMRDNVSDVCHAFSNGTSAPCAMQCTSLDDYCQNFFYASSSSSSSSSLSGSSSWPSRLLFSSPAALVETTQTGGLLSLIHI